MCGVAAIIGEDQNNLSKVMEMVRLVRHRGPDNLSVKSIEDCKIVLGHARLEIVDHDFLSNQPMVSNCGNYHLVFNGEIYNHSELQQELIALGYTFKTMSDTEVLLKSFQEWGIECLERFNGMFAFIIVDSKARKVIAARDRFGVKPLYIGYALDGSVCIASEIKQFTAKDVIHLQENQSSVANFLKYGTVPLGSDTFFRNIEKLMPGHFIEIDPDADDLQISLHKWFSLDNHLASDTSNVESKFKELFDDSLKLRLECDVKRGLGFSGGLDSSAILFSIDKGKAGYSDIETFSGRFTSGSVDEGVYINAGVKYSKFHHNDIRIAPKLDLRYLTELAWSHDEPLLTSAVIAQDKLYESMAEKGVRVSIDGLGADEALGGYKSFYRPVLRSTILSGSFKNYMQQVRSMRSSLGVSFFTPIFWTISSLLPNYLRATIRQFIRRCYVPNRLFTEEINRNSIAPDTRCEGLSLRDYSEHLISYGGLVPQLQWADRNSMRHSIEARSPFLDYRLVEYALALADEWKLKNGKNKIVLRRALGQRIPSEILSRYGKQGFESPEKDWMLVDNADRVKEILRHSTDRYTDLFTCSGKRYLEDILEGKRSYDSLLWRTLSIIAWRNAFWKKS